MTRTIQTANGDVLADLSPPSLADIFGIPWHPMITMPDKANSEATYKKDVDGCRKHMNEHWAKSKRSSLVKFPQVLYRSDFHEKIRGPSDLPKKNIWIAHNINL